MKTRYDTDIGKIINLIADIEEVGVYLILREINELLQSEACSVLVVVCVHVCVRGPSDCE